MNKQDMSKIQSCVLRVNVHCDGCKHKIKKKLQKIKGVYEVRMDVEQGKLTVSGNVDPATIIKKLDKAGKHAELWEPQKGPTTATNGRFENMHISKDSRTQNGGFQATQQKNDLKDVRFLSKLILPEEEEDDDFDEDDNEFDDEFEEGFAAHHQPATSNGYLRGKTGSNNDKKSKQGSGMNVFFKGILGKAGGKSGSGSPGQSRNKAANQNGGDKKGYKNGAISKKGAAAAHKNYNDSWSKKVGQNFDGVPKLKGKQRQQGLNEMNIKCSGGGDGKTGPMGGQVGNFRGGHIGPMGGQMGNFHGGHIGPMGSQMGDFENVRRLHPVTAMSLSNFQGNPYHQQQLAHMMMMNQRHEDAYVRSQPAMSYGPPPMTDQYTHIFSDENTSSCSIM